jgi:Protein of unknown function (DUF3710)
MEVNPTKELMVFRRRRETDDSLDSAQSDVVEDEFDDSEDDFGDDREDDLEEASPGRDRPVASIDDLGEYVPSTKGQQSSEYAVVLPPRPTGPWDSHDLPKTDEVPRIDLGGLRVPVPDGLEVRVEVQDDVPVAATLVDGNSALQIHAFAAPKSSGLWADVRAEIAESLNSSGGSATEVEGTFGPELRARILDETGASQTARFIGVDGPRWFLRGLLTGAGSTDPLQANRLEEAFRLVVVHRGTDAMAPRDMLPLHLPREAFEAAEHDHDHDGHDHDGHDHTFQLPERGPEITEIQ